MSTLGIGMMFPNVYQGILQSAKAGEYGDEWKELTNKSKLIAIDVSQKLYLCPCCGYWKVDHDLSLYEPLDEDSIQSKQYGIKTVAEWGEAPYVSYLDLSNDYLEIAHYIHKCDKCGSVLLEVEETQFDYVQGIGLKCPKCSELNEITGTIMWD